MIFFASLFFLAEGLVNSDDSVTNLPGWGVDYTGVMYAGYIPITPSCHSAMFYWMLEKEGGSDAQTPVLLWLNGGPGASSVTGLMAENIGPYQLSGETFTYNQHAWTDKYNVLIIDNPVGSGYSVTDDRVECYSSTELKVAADFYIALNTFFNELHTEYAKNPFFLTGESYAGKYIPNIAAYLHDKNFPFEGVILGNGLYEPQIQYLTVPDYAWNLAIIDEKDHDNMTMVASYCSYLIRDGKDPAFAAEYCEGMVDTIYGDIGQGVFRYNVQKYYNVFANVTTDLGKYLNRADVQAALHTTGHIWKQSDETGPVADALRADFVKSVLPELKVLLDANYMVVLYNGQMDGSVCNHVGNTLILDAITWNGQEEFKIKNQTLWRVDTQNVIGFRRVYKNFAYVMIANAGHLVPMNQPENFRLFLDTAINGSLTQQP